MAMKMLEVEAGVKTNFLKNSHLIDHDEKMLLGMIWSIILHYAINGINEGDVSAKEGLLLWCRKKTKGYNHVDPPTITNFHKNWNNGLAFAALIHRHVPEAIDYDSLDPSDRAGNLSKAFDAAEQLGIPRLLDVEDCLVDKPDERSIMTQVAEYFHRFASHDAKEISARRVAKFLKFAKDIATKIAEYERRAGLLNEFIEKSTATFGGNPEEVDSLEDVNAIAAYFRDYIVTQKPAQAGEKLDIETLFAEIQTTLKVNGRKPYVPPEDKDPETIDGGWQGLWDAEKKYSEACRQQRLGFVKKAVHELTDEQKEEFTNAFNHFDGDGSKTLTQVEFKAACSAMSIPFKSDEALAKKFQEVAQGDTIELEEWIVWMTALNEDRDDPVQIKESFRELAGGKDTVTEAQLNVPPLEKGDFVCLEPYPKDDGYDYITYVDSTFL
jgi:hypothetical protein